MADTNTSSSPVGSVEVANGQVTATSINGNERVLQKGSQVYEGDTIRTGMDGAVAIALNNGQRFDLGRNSEAVLDSDVLGQDPAAAQAAATMEAEAIAAAQAEAERRKAKKIEQARLRLKNTKSLYKFELINQDTIKPLTRCFECFGIIKVTGWHRFDLNQGHFSTPIRLLRDRRPLERLIKLLGP